MKLIFKSHKPKQKPDFFKSRSFKHFYYFTFEPRLGLCHACSCFFWKRRKLERISLGESVFVAIEFIELTKLIIRDLEEVRKSQTQKQENQKWKTTRKL